MPLASLEPGPDQPRRAFDSGALDELARSIEQQGILQPIVVTPLPEAPGRFRIVAGERRWRAAQRAGLSRVPVVVREVDDPARLELALVENIQRTDLSPVEEARAYRHLMDLRGYTQEKLAERVGKDRSTVANALRLLRLPDKVLDMLSDGRISAGHARALLGLTHEADQLALAREVARRKLSVRATEREVRARTADAAPDAAPTAEPDEAARRRIILADLETRLRRHTGVRARVRGRPGKPSAGVLELPYSNLDELDRLLSLLLDSAP